MQHKIQRKTRCHSFNPPTHLLPFTVPSSFCATSVCVVRPSCFSSVKIIAVRHKIKCIHNARTSSIREENTSYGSYTYTNTEETVETHYLRKFPVDFAPSRWAHPHHTDVSQTNTSWHQIRLATKNTIQSPQPALLLLLPCV